MQVGDEVEAKFDIDPEANLPSFARAVPDAEVLELDPVELTAVYFDTPGSRLLRQGATLRRRRSAESGGENLWTLKLPTSAGVAYSRKEISWPGDSDAVPPEAIELVSGIAFGETLAEVAEVVSRRRRLVVRADTGGSVAEIDDDTVTVRRPSELVFRQVEVELVRGDPELLGRIGKSLEKAGATRGSDEPKLARALGRGPDRAGTGLVGANEPLHRATIGQVVSASLGAALARLLSNDPGVRLDEDPEFVHQARVATRRLRSDLRTYRPFLEAGWVADVRSELRWVGTALGEVRDADVLSERLASYASAAGADDEGGFGELRDHLAAERAASVTALRRVMLDDRYLKLLRRIESAADSPPIAPEVDRSAPAGESLGPLVEASWRRARKQVRSLDPAPSDAGLHQVRIKAKQLRYAAEATEAVLGGPARRLARAAEAVQTVLGEHQDAVAAGQWARRAAQRTGAEGILAAGQVIALERLRQAGARRAWPRSWKRLRKAAAGARDLGD
jgi:CHAD domain-containing protein